MSQDVIHANLAREMKNVNQYGIDVIKINVVTKLKCKSNVYINCVPSMNCCLCMRCNLYEKMVILPSKGFSMFNLIQTCEFKSVISHVWKEKNTKPSKLGITMKSLAC
jgi:hypothetical protein